MSYSRHPDRSDRFSGPDRFKYNRYNNNEIPPFSRGSREVNNRPNFIEKDYSSSRFSDRTTPFNKYHDRYRSKYDEQPRNDYERSMSATDSSSSNSASEYKQNGHVPSSSRERPGSYGFSSPNGSYHAPEPKITNVTYLTEPYKAQKHHSSNLRVTVATEIKRSYKIIYDPDLSKDKSEGKTPKYRKNDSVVKPKDPRTLMHKYPVYHVHHKLSNKTLYRELKKTRFVHDENSLGPPPDNEIIIWGFSINTSESLIKNNMKSFGPIEQSSMVVDKVTGAPLGVYRLKFLGSPDKSASLARAVVNQTDKKMKLNGKTIRSSLNGSDNKVLDEIISSKLGQKRRQTQEKVSALKQIPKGPKGPKSAQGPSDVSVTKSLMEIGSAEVKALFNDPAINDVSKSNSKTLVSRSITNHIKNLEEFTVPEDLKDYIKGRPFIFILANNAPISVASMKSYLHSYAYTRVLLDKAGFFIVFRCLKYANECFRAEFGKEVLIPTENSRRILCKLNMQLVVSAGWDDLFTGPEIISDSRKFLLNDFKMKLIRDVSDELNATVMDLLDPKNFPDAVAKLKEAAEKKKVSNPTPIKSETVSSPHSFVNTTDIFSISRGDYKLPKLPNIKKTSFGNKRDRDAKNVKKLSRKSRFDMLPMSHALNYNSDDESKTGTPEETPAPESETDDEENSVQENQAVDGVEATSSNADSIPEVKKSKLQLDIKGEDFDVDMEDPISKPTTPEDGPEQKVAFMKEPAAIEKEGEAEEAKEEEEVEDEEEEEGETKADFSKIDPRYRPSTNVPFPVYEPLEDRFVDYDLISSLSIIKDQEDLELAKEVFSNITPSAQIHNVDYWVWKQKDSRSQNELFEKLNTLNGNSAKSEENPELDVSFENSSGSWKSEGFKKIPDKKKAAYLPHKRRLDQPLNTVELAAEDSKQQNSGSSTNNSSSNPANNSLQSSRVNRANNRRLVADIKSISTETDLLELNALTKRKKPVSFARSAIHNWGLYALEPISSGEMIIEYVGDRIRQQVAEVREKRYLKSGIGSSYLFRIDENTVIDATKKGGIARFINHCCIPSCTAKIIKVEGKKRIVIYALRDIAANEELTYDYKFERETNNDERIPCLCGAPGCKGFLN